MLIKLFGSIPRARILALLFGRQGHQLYQPACGRQERNHVRDGSFPSDGPKGADELGGSWYC